MAAEQFVNFRVTRRKINAVHRRSCVQQHLNRVWRSSIFPVRVRAGTYGQRQRRAPVPVECIYVGSALDKELYGCVLRAPSRRVQRRTILGHIEIRVAFFIYSSGVHAEFKQLPHALRISDARELRKQFAPLRNDLANELSLALRDGSPTRRILSRASRNQPFHAGKLDRNASPFEQLKYIATSSSHGHRDGRLPCRCRYLSTLWSLRNERRISAMLQQHFEDFDVVIPQHSVMNCPLSPSRLCVRVNAPLEQPFDAPIIMPLGFSQ